MTLYAVTKPNTKIAWNDWAKQAIANWLQAVRPTADFDFSKGNPKGAMLTHENVVANAAAFLRTIEVSYY